MSGADWVFIVGLLLIVALSAALSWAFWHDWNADSIDPWDEED